MRLFYFLSHPRSVLIALLERVGGWIPDKPYLRLIYQLNTGRRLHLNPPRTFNEKIQWLKLYDRKPLYTTLVDKVKVKDYVASIIGKEYIVPTLGLWDRPEDIEWEKLPERFVLKTTHDGGGEGVIICDKNKLNKGIVLSKLNKSLRRNIYRSLREWPYKGVRPRIMAETYIQESTLSNEGLKDYKFYCFNGEPLFCQVKSHEGGKDCIDLFDMEWQLLPFTGVNPKQQNAQNPPCKPINYETMILLATKLCGVAAFTRIDFYNIEGRIFFGEITFYPASGMGVFTPKQYDSKLGQLINVNYCLNENMRN